MEREQKKLRWGIIGLGKMARIFTEDLQRVNEAEIYAVASRSEEKAHQFARDFSAKKAYSSYQELIADKYVDVIYIATPHAFHFDIALACLKAKKHVLCEKPMCLNVEHTKLLIEESKKQNCFLMEAIWTRFMPSTKTFLTLIEDGFIGELICLNADFGFQPQFDPSSRLFNTSLGGGSLMDIGIYPVFLSLLCFGEPFNIKADAKFTSTGVDLSCIMEFFYEDGKEANLASTFEHATPTEAQIYGTNGSLRLTSRFHQSQYIEIFDAKNQLQEKIHLPYQGNGYVHEIEEVHTCINKGSIESSLLTHPFSMQLAQLLETVREEIGLRY